MFSLFFAVVGRIRMEVFTKQKTPPNGRCFLMVESGGLEPSTFRV